jgi:hypothetical protein
MKVQTTIKTMNNGTWAQVYCRDWSRTETLDIHIPLAQKTYPNLSTEEAVQKAARKRFKKSDEYAFNGYD